MRLTLPKSKILRRQADFQLLLKERKGFSRGDILQCYVRHCEPHQQPMFGVSVSRKAGNAVLRNRIKRIAKEFYRIHQAEWDHYMVLFLAKRPFSGDAALLRQELESFLRSHTLRCLSTNKTAKSGASPC